jgi:hypothetical protein
MAQRGELRQNSQDSRKKNKWRNKVFWEFEEETLP